MREVEMQALRSEDDIRAKVVVPWLLAHGFPIAALSIEFSFRIRLGRSVLGVSGGATSRHQSKAIHSPRADVLVRNDRGDNLLIVEVKAPGEPLDDRARDQGISYARCIAEGNIAPYVVLTNGESTRVFDSISRLELGRDVRLSDACSSRTFYVTPDELSLRAEALEALISFSPENLMAFCDAQARFRMKPLLGEGVDSDKKFIPELFVEREDIAFRLADALDVKGHRVTLLTGHPQVGKTNVVCHAVLNRLAAGQPCLFYPAMGLQKSLLAELAHDFEWEFSGASDTYSQLARKLNNVLQRANKRLTIFIDGLNETSVQLARAIDADCSRVSGDRVQIVISFTHSSAPRILRDAGGNSSYLAEEAGISAHGANLIALDPEAAVRTNDWNLIHVSRYSPEERDRAYEVYASAYRVTVPKKSHKKTRDPYVLGIAMREYRGGQLPDSLDEPSLLRRFLDSKMGRAVGLEEYNIPLCLRELGREMIRAGAPVPIEALCRIWSHPIAQKIPSGFFESALLMTEVDAHGQLSVDFYYGRERDYVIACMAQEWPEKLRAHDDMEAEFSASVATCAGSDALAWFLRQPAHVEMLAALPGGVPIYSDPRVRRTLLSSLCEYTSTQGVEVREVLRFAVTSAMNDPDNLARIEAVKLVAMASDEPNDLASVLGHDSSLSDLIEAILGIGEEFPFKAEDAGQVVLDALRTLHWDFGDSDDDGTSLISHILIGLSEHPAANVRKEANTCLGYAAPFAFVQSLAEKIARQSEHIRQDNFGEFAEGIRNAAGELSESYYGSMCPGALEAILENPDYQADEYLKMSRALGPIIAVFGGIDGTDTFQSILEDLGRGLSEATDAAPNVSYVDTRTLPLRFEDEGK
ncbi:type I restriction enzyme HsdR N-terminal domain-containing protein [Ramlibacter algicola]|uniref:Type I restriction enzyme HsdR N-terminal domain-containing protein n=1 Tax=Ramlibacter algicola TaxID=2795217 RepID=A0A934PZ82_9BURK|nr:type I restriction enzyme HsdR N-terminal domain-containing protein [Ramlibacter algicola]MBK0392113.1 type I restriction enzyme HsdR N-terminal domain-containing protein [Ramlibacter algicola]